MVLPRNALGSPQLVRFFEYSLSSYAIEMLVKHVKMEAMIRRNSLGLPQASRERVARTSAPPSQYCLTGA